MKLSEQARRHILRRETEEKVNAYRKPANIRKRAIYWIGFLEGVLASGRIEAAEPKAIAQEVGKFAEFFDDPDTDDLAQDIAAECFSDEADLTDQIRSIIAEKKAAMAAQDPYGETDHFNEFLGFCAGIICDGVILEKETYAILTRFQESTVLSESAVFADLRQSVERALSDHRLTPEEAKDVEEWIAHLVGDGFADTGLASLGHVAKLDDPITDPAEIDIKGSTFVLTGPMKIGPRHAIVAEIMRHGGLAEDRVTQRATYVVVSDEASRQWRTTHFGTKIERAFELIRDGHPVRFVAERALNGALKTAAQR